MEGKLLLTSRWHRAGGGTLRHAVALIDLGGSYVVATLVNPEDDAGAGGLYRINGHYFRDVIPAAASFATRAKKFETEYKYFLEGGV